MDLDNSMILIVFILLRITIRLMVFRQTEVMVRLESLLYMRFDAKSPLLWQLRQDPPMLRVLNLFSWSWRSCRRWRRWCIGRSRWNCWRTTCRRWRGRRQSEVSANFQVYTTLLKPHERIMALDLPSSFDSRCEKLQERIIMSHLSTGMRREKEEEAEVAKVPC